MASGNTDLAPVPTTIINWQLLVLFIVSRYAFVVSNFSGCDDVDKIAVITVTVYL